MVQKSNRKKNFPNMPEIGGIRLSAIDAGISKSKKLDLMLVEVSPGSKICGLLTKSRTCSAAVQSCRKNLKMDQDYTKPIGIVVNSGNANVFTGKSGQETVKKTIIASADILKTKKENIFVASTGVIGEKLDHKKITCRMNDLVANLNRKSFFNAAEAIMTTDTYPKGAFKQFSIKGENIKIIGIAKGSGMIEPNMATMLVFIFSDILIKKSVLQKILKKCNNETFNAITVDGDTSTSDSLLCVATGKAKMSQIESLADPRASKFRKCLQDVMMELAHLVIKDGEGATKFIKVQVTGAKSKKSARKIGKTIANSPLVKTAFAGEDPNWGRIVMAVGKSGEKINQKKLSIYFGNYLIAENGSVSKSYLESKAAKYMKKKSLLVRIDIGLGSKESSVYTCDFTHEYIKINADYRS